MAEWVTVNGAMIERRFFEENLAEARRYTWTRGSPGGPAERHVHCIICNIAIALDGGEFYESAGGALCSYCYAEFIAQAKGGVPNDVG